MHVPDLPSNEALLGELEALENLLGGDRREERLTALIRLIHDDADWPELLRRHELDEWLALPLDLDRFPALNVIQERIRELSFQRDHDALSGLRNRRAYEQALDLEVERAGRFKTALTLCIVDLDNFKALNDTYGHPCGDKVIQAMAKILHDETRKIDIPARIGGEEFALILPGTGLTRAQRLLERILATVRSALVDCGGTTVSFTCSIGFASYRGKHAPEKDILVAEADRALYRAKGAGKNRLEAAPLLDLGPTRDETLVQHTEKRFLFSSFFAPMDGEADLKD